VDKREIIMLDKDIIERASEIYAESMKERELIEDVDTLIAASCLVKGMVLVTDNEKHFRRTL